MDNRILQLEKKEIIVKNALQIIEHLNNQEFPRWKEFINRKIDTFISTIWQLYTLGDNETTRLMMHKIIELEMIRDNPELALGTKISSITETVINTSFKQIRLEKVYENEKISATFPIVNPKEKKYSTIEEARRNKIGGAEYCVEFTPNLKQYNEIVANHYNKTLTNDNIISLISAIMFYCNFSDDEIITTLQEDFNYSKEVIPSAKDLKYVAIVWGNNNPFKSNQATLSIPCEEMEHNQNDGEYNIFFSRGYANPRDVKQYSSNYFLNSIYSNFSEIYSSKFNDSDAIPYEIDNYYAIFA